MQSPSQHNPEYNDEIDLFDIFETIWQGKFIILTTVVLTLLGAVGYINLTPIKYQIEVPYTVQLHSLESQQLCGGNYKCLDAATRKLIHQASSPSISGGNKASSWVLISMDQSDSELIKERLAAASVSVTSAINYEAQTEFELISNQLPSELLTTERVATSYLNAKRLLDKIARGVESVVVTEPTVTIISPKTKLVVALSIVIGGMMGIFLVFLRKGAESYRKRVKG
jgi:capsular polysaccharide biosynthesis protein